MRYGYSRSEYSSHEMGGTMRHATDLSPQPVVLGLLMSQPRHGYELYQKYRRDLARVWHIGLSQLYALLGQLQESGLVAAHTEVQPTRPARKVYTLTAAGREAFLKWLSRPTPYLRHMRMEMPARVYFFQELSLPGASDWITVQKAVCRERASHYAQLAVQTEGFRSLVLDFRRGQLEAVVPWLDACLRALSPMPEGPRPPERED